MVVNGASKAVDVVAFLSPGDISGVIARSSAPTRYYSGLETLRP
jgi:hypothetical protein